MFGTLLPCKCCASLNLHVYSQEGCLGDMCVIAAFQHQLQVAGALLPVVFAERIQHVSAQESSEQSSVFACRDCTHLSSNEPACSSGTRCCCKSTLWSHPHGLFQHSKLLDKLSSRTVFCDYCRGAAQQSLQSFDEVEQALLDQLLESPLPVSLVAPPASEVSAESDLSPASSSESSHTSTALGVVGMLRRLTLWTQEDAKTGKLTILPRSMNDWLRSTKRCVFSPCLDHSKFVSAFGLGVHPCCDDVGLHVIKQCVTISHCCT